MHEFKGAPVERNRGKAEYVSPVCTKVPEQESCSTDPRFTNGAGIIHVFTCYIILAPREWSVTQTAGPDFEIEKPELTASSKADFSTKKINCPKVQLLLFALTGRVQMMTSSLSK